MRERIVAAVKAEVTKVLSHPLAAEMRGFAEHLAYESDLTAEQAIGCMRAFAQDLNAPRQSVTSFETRRREAGTLGLGPASGSDASDACWSHAIEAANARLGPAAKN
ncbi:MAG: hypothetical protein JJ969_10785 [Rhizobiaceae bacterium]|nr:hypothetical protein [Rhizobiaceae bacterium]